MNLLVSLVPIALYLAVLQVFDAFSMARWRKLAGSLFWGMASAACMLLVVWTYRQYVDASGWQSVYVSPVIEECLKALPLTVLVMRRRVVFFAETQIYGQMVGGGFALVENILYVLAQPDMALGTALVRGLGTSMLHMGCTAMLCSAALLLLRMPALLPLALIPSAAVHIIYNMQLVQPIYGLLAVVVLFLAVFAAMSHIGERMVLRWMDVSIQNDVVLLSALKRGELLDTPAGQYLMSIKERFDAFVFFDMCVYVQMYLELLMEGKSRIMLRDAGLDSPATEEQKALHKERLAELDALSDRISLLGHHLLRPILRPSAQNMWAIRTLS